MGSQFGGHRSCCSSSQSSTVFGHRIAAAVTAAVVVPDARWYVVYWDLENWNVCSAACQREGQTAAVGRVNAQTWVELVRHWANLAQRKKKETRADGSSLDHASRCYRGTRMQESIMTYSFFTTLTLFLSFPPLITSSRRIYILKYKKYTIFLYHV